MTAPLEFEEEEALAIEGSHLVKVKCRGCGNIAICAPHLVNIARCVNCLGGGGAVPPGTPYTAVRGSEFQREWITPHESWLRGKVETAEKWPDVEHAGPWATALAAGEAPAPVLSLAEVAREAHWEKVLMRYARGYFKGVGKNKTLKHSVAVGIEGHLLAGGRQVRAVMVAPVSRVAWSWQGIWVYGPDIGFRGELGITELKEFLREPDKSVAWFDEIRAEALRKVEAARKAARGRIKKAATEVL